MYYHVRWSQVGLMSLYQGVLLFICVVHKRHTIQNDSNLFKKKEVH